MNATSDLDFETSLVKELAEPNYRWMEAPTEGRSVEQVLGDNGCRCEGAVSEGPYVLFSGLWEPHHDRLAAANYWTHVLREALGITEANILYNPESGNVGILVDKTKLRAHSKAVAGARS